MTPRDFSTHFKSVLHRNLLFPSGTRCPMCHKGAPYAHHLAVCPSTAALWGQLGRLCGTRLATAEERLFPANLPMPAVAFVLLAWKALIVQALTALNENKPCLRAYRGSTKRRRAATSLAGPRLRSPGPSPGKPRASTGQSWARSRKRVQKL